MESFIANHLVAASIFSFCFVWMCFFAVKDHRSLKAGNHNDLKSVIVSIGVLGTFIGIFLGLWEFDTENIDSSVPKLLEGLKLAFATSIVGMFISIYLSTIQRNLIIGGNDELSILNEIKEKLSGLDLLESVVEQIKGLRLEIRDEQRQTRQGVDKGFQSTQKELIDINTSLSGAARDETINNLRIDIHEEQLKVRNFLEEQFKATNDSLREAIDVLSRGATEEIIKALETVISDFNHNLVEQFGDNFKQLNEAVKSLLIWQEQYKDIVKHDYSLLVEIRNSLNGTQSVLELIASRNEEFKNVYEQLSTLINTYDTQLSSLNSQLEQYSKMGEKATAAFEKLENGFEKVQLGMGGQSEAITKLTEDIGKSLPEALGKLEGTLVGLTTKFAADYESFLDHYKQLTTIQQGA